MVIDRAHRDTHNSTQLQLRLAEVVLHTIVTTFATKMPKMNSKKRRYGKKNESNEGGDDGEEEPGHINTDEGHSRNDLEERSQRLHHRIRN